MAVVAQLVDAADLHETLAATIDELKAGQPLCPVTVVVPTNATGVSARRLLGRAGGIAAIDMLTLRRVAEVLGGPALARRELAPLSTPVLDLTIERVLASESTAFNAVRRHPATIYALRELYAEVRLAGPASLAALRDGGRRAAAVASVLESVRRQLADRWFDEADLFTAAIDKGGELPSSLQRVVLFAPHPPTGLELDLLDLLGRRGELRVIAARTGDAAVDDEYRPLWHRLGLEPAPDPASRVHARLEVVSTTDAETEVLEAVDRLVTAARDGVPFARMALLWPTNEPYARLVEHHLNRASIPWNGRPGTTPIERVVPRFLMHLLDVDRAGLSRDALFELLADIPGRDGDGEPIPVARWERVSRSAGVAHDQDWEPRLAAYARRRRAQASDGDDAAEARVADADAAEALARYVRELRTELGHPAATRRWSEWASWSETQIRSRLGDTFLSRLGEPEHLAREHTARVLERLATLDVVSEPVTRAKFRSVFEAEFDVAPGRLGRLGVGVTIGTVTGQVGLDADLAIVLGAADGFMPPRPNSGPLLSADDRQAARLPAPETVGRRMQRQLLSMLASVDQMMITYPRGDLRASSERHPSRWIEPLLDSAATRDAESFYAATRNRLFPADRWSFRLRSAAAIDAIRPDHPAIDDRVLERSLTMRAARRSATVTEFDGDLSALPIDHPDRPVSATQLETWPACPHAYLMRYVLGVRPVDDPAVELKISPLNRGNLVHHVLDRLHREVLDGALAQPTHGWNDRHRQRALELYDDLAAEFEATGRTGRPASWVNERRALRRELLNWLVVDSDLLAALGATIVGSEIGFGRDGDVALATADASRVAVFGTIDRIVQGADGHLYVTDYKTGRPGDAKKLDATDPTLGGRKFQLPIYAAAAEQLVPGATPPTDARYSYFAVGRYERYGYQVDDVVWRQVGDDLQRIRDGINAGFFPALPEAPSGFQVRVGCVYCQPDGLTIADRYSEFEAKSGDERFVQFGLVEATEDEHDTEQHA